MRLFGKKKSENKDFDLFSKDGLLGYIRSNLKNPTDENVSKVVEHLAKPDDDLEHLTPDGDLPWGWHTYTLDFTQKIGSEYSYFLQNWADSRSKSPKDQYSALKSFVLYMRDVEKVCKEKGECFEFWFYKILTGSGYIEKREADLKYLTDNFDDLCKEYDKRQQFEKLKQQRSVEIKADVIRMLEENDGILQSEFWKLFDDEISSAVASDIVYELRKSGKIERTKSGRSYILHYKGKN